ADKFRKFLVASGAFSGIIAISIAPTSVSSVTHCPAIFSSGAPSNGSPAGAGAAAALVFTFFGGSTGAFDCPLPAVHSPTKLKTTNPNLSILQTPVHPV